MPTLDTVSQWWDRVRTSFWFVPALMGLAALLLGIVVPAIDRGLPDDRLPAVPLLFSGRPSGARAVLSTIATAIITTAGVVFSMTIVSLQLASSQFGPRLLRTFLRDRGNQVVLGTFVGIFLYCLLVLPTIDATAASPFVPHVAVTVGVLLAIVGLGMLVYFIDHVAQSIHADAVIRSVGNELNTVIDHLFPEPVGEGERSEDDEDPPAVMAGAPAQVTSAAEGYLRFINGDVIVAAAAKHDLIVRFETQPGQYVFAGDELASVWPRLSATPGIEDLVRGAFVLGAHRTTLQDAPFAFEQLTEMAVRALSPGINDPTTAIHCLDRIGSGLARLVGRRVPSRLRRDPEGAVRVVAEPVRLEEIFRGTVDPIARNAGHQLSVWVRLLEVLEATFDRARRSADRELLRAAAGVLTRQAHEVFDGKNDHRRLAEVSAWMASSRIK